MFVNESPADILDRLHPRPSGPADYAIGYGTPEMDRLDSDRAAAAKAIGSAWPLQRLMKMTAAEIREFSEDDVDALMVMLAYVGRQSDARNLLGKTALAKFNHRRTYVESITHSKDANRRTRMLADGEHPDDIADREGRERRVS